MTLFLNRANNTSTPRGVRSFKFLLFAVTIICFPGTSYAGFPNDFSDVTWLHKNVSSWPATTSLAVGFSGDSINLRHTQSNTWPGRSVFSCASCNANAWVFIKRDGRWYAATWEWMRSGQQTKNAGAVNGSHIKKAPFNGLWQPTVGETYGFMVSGLARISNISNIQERSTPVLVKWPRNFPQVVGGNTGVAAANDAIQGLADVGEGINESELPPDSAGEDGTGNSDGSGTFEGDETIEEIVEAIAAGVILDSIMDAIGGIGTDSGGGDGDGGGDGGDSDNCEGGCIYLMLQSFGEAWEGIREALLEPLGESVQQWTETNAAGFNQTAQSIVEVSRIEVNEQHLLAEKKATLNIKQSINDKFGSKADDVAILGNVESPLVGDDIVRQLTKGGQIISKQIGDSVQGAGLRTAMMSAMPDNSLKLIQHLSEERILEKNSNEAYSLMLKVLTESKWFPAPASVSQSNTEDEYRVRYVERQRKLDFAKSMIHDYIAKRMYVVDQPDNAEFYNIHLQEAEAQNAPGYMSDYLAIKALGLNQFGSNNAFKVGGLSGDELKRKLAYQISINNFLRARLAEEMSDLAALKSVRSTLKIAEAHDPALVEALKNADR